MSLFVCLLIVGPCPQQITITSTGEAKAWQNRFGTYNLLRYDDSGRAIYGKSLGMGKYVYKVKDSDSIWMVSKPLIFRHLRN